MKFGVLKYLGFYDVAEKSEVSETFCVNGCGHDSVIIAKYSLNN